MTKESSNNKAPDTALCPLCGEPNHCALAVNAAATACWCDEVVFPEELLAQIPETAARKTCVCKNCLDKFLDKSSRRPTGASRP